MAGLLVLPALLGLAVAASAASSAATTAQETEAQRWVQLASDGLDPRALAALGQIHGAGRQLLALRGYLRTGDTLAARWSWSAEQIAAYPDSEEGRATATALDAVAQSFAAANPGYTLSANREPRSLAAQIAAWNGNASVTRAADLLLESLRQQAQGKADAARLRTLLMNWPLPTPVTLAAPGLSAHGQGRAYDFRVSKDGLLIAGPEAATARQRWDAAGWTDRLRAAIKDSGQPFSGPLQAPYEPWHYSWSPAAHPATRP
ncbi:MAG: hypothetical protein QM718_12865 [Steroidobacteraceae bacterium]